MQHRSDRVREWDAGGFIGLREPPLAAPHAALLVRVVYERAVGLGLRPGV